MKYIRSRETSDSLYVTINDMSGTVIKKCDGRAIDMVVPIIIIGYIYRD